MSGTTIGVKFKLLWNTKGMLNKIKRHYMYPGCQNGILSIFQEQLENYIKVRHLKNFEGDS